MNQIPEIKFKMIEEYEVSSVKRTKKFLKIFSYEWWETLSERYLGSDIHINTQKDIRCIYLNGKEIYINPQQ